MGWSGRVVKNTIILLIVFFLYQHTIAGAQNRVGCLYNGYLLTADPILSLSSQSTENRYRLYVLHAVLIDTDTGKIVATYPQLPGQHTSGPIAQPISAYPDLLSDETPPEPGITLTALTTYWRNQGIDDHYFTDIQAINLGGAVVTPGITDDHFHVTSWSKKVPAPGERFGFWADVNDAAYYTDPDTMERLAARESLWRIVADANAHLQDIGSDKLYLHGYLKTVIDDPAPGDIQATTYMYQTGGSSSVSERNPIYLLNRVGIAPGVPVEPPSDPNDPATWPSLDYDTAPVVMVHTSGQACWYNPPVLDAFNLYQESTIGHLFDSVDILSLTPPTAPDDPVWIFNVDPSSSSDLLGLDPVFPVDMVAWPNQPEETIHVPFQVVEILAASGVVRAQPVFQVLADTYLAAPGTPVKITPYYRVIAPVISEEYWDEAAAFNGNTTTIDDVAYGDWDPHRPYHTNWYNGAERGLIEYFHDRDAHVWRPTGYAEHYVIRDALSSFVLEDPSVEECMTHRRRMTEWCHRHGITAVNDIMFYRRQTNRYEFESYEALSWDHDPESMNQQGRRTSLEKLPYNLRVKLYYYIENAGDITETLELANNSVEGLDTNRLKPDQTHPEWPGWVAWQGWKMQLDGGTGARTICSSALISKARCMDAYQTTDENSNEITFLDHSFGLLTMSNKQEQIFNSRETAALYWLVRESDPASPFHNPAISNDWSFLAEGVVGFLDRSIVLSDLIDDLDVLNHIVWPPSGDDQNQPDDMADKIVKLLEQIQDGYRKLLISAATIWYEQSVQELQGHSMPDQQVCHCLGDGAVDLWCQAINTIRDDLRVFPDSWNDLPTYWQAAIPSGTNLEIIRKTFERERFRVEHLQNFSAISSDIVVGVDGLNDGVSPVNRNIVFSTQPALLACDGQVFREYVFPYAQELWPIPNNSEDDFWMGVPWRPRVHHQMPCPLWRDLDIPFTLNTDPPSIRDPRPGTTLIAAVARTPFEVNPSTWVGAAGDDPTTRPPDYLAGKIYLPLGLTTSTPDNPMGLTIEQALCAMTFWGAYVSEDEDRYGALAAPINAETSWYADMVIWRSNPLAIRGASGLSLEDLGSATQAIPEADRLDVINAVLTRFLPKMTFIGGTPVWQFGVRIDMPLMVYPDDEFHVTGYLDNPGSPLTDIPVFFLLDVYGEFWFWPSWVQFQPPENAVDFEMVDLSTGTTAIEVLPSFTWPHAGEAHGLYMYGAMLNQAMTEIMGEMAIVEFGCSEN